ncbi:MAG TPA: hypothetical protein VMF89_16660 [Polyangiales bacterium]|nr:hypothetical protein [Polyangiales bacterium]
MTQTSAATPSLLEDPKISEELAAPADPPADSHDAELADFTRLEALLFARTRSHGDLQRELGRRERLFREALVRMSTSTSQEFSALRAGYDAAVARAIEAEVARAELTFALDETRTQLTAAAPSASVVNVVNVVNVGDTPSVYARAADHSEQADALHRAVSERAALAAENLALRARFEALRGELNGVRARLGESEEAWLAAVGQTQKAHQRVTSTQDRISELRVESAELTLLAQTRAARIAELTQAAAFDQQEIRTLRAQVVAANAAQVAQGEAREADRQLWAERLQKHEEGEQEAWKSAASAVARSETRLREFLGSLGTPLRELDAVLDALNSQGAQPPETAPASFDVSPDGRTQEPKESKAASGPGGRRIADELAQERDRRTKLVAAVRALQAATQSGEPTKPWIEELVELVAETRPSARRRS